MDIQLIIVALCIAAAAFFVIRRMVRAMRKGQWGCGCDSGCGSTDRSREMSCCCTGKSADDDEARRLESARIDSGHKPEERQ